jgi:dephospho-CoA kinase
VAPNEACGTSSALCHPERSRGISSQSLVSASDALKTSEKRTGQRSLDFARDDREAERERISLFLFTTPRTPKFPVPLFGITGGVATGKSTFTKLLAARLGAAVFSSDAAARQLLESDADALAALRAEFGDAVFDPATGAVRRDLLRELVFASEERRRALEAILHPRIRAGWTRWAEEKLQTDPNTALLVEIPLLYETGAEAFLDRVIVVACGPAAQWRRLIEVRGLPAAIARQVIASQLPLSEKIRRCDHLIWNDDIPAPAAPDHKSTATLSAPSSSSSSNSLSAQADLCASCLQAAYNLSPVAVVR